MRNDADACISILEDLNYQNINHIASKNELRFSREEGTNPTSMKLSLETIILAVPDLCEYNFVLIPLNVPKDITS